MAARAVDTFIANMCSGSNSLHAEGKVSPTGFSESDRDTSPGSDKKARALSRAVTDTGLIVSRALVPAQ